MSSKIIYHNHHIIPKHMGGSDDPSNLIKLTVKEHAEAHLSLYKKHGKEEDRIAYLALSKQISISEASHRAWVIGSIKGGYAKKPNSVPAHNKIDFYCIGCRKKDKPYAIINGHKRCRGEAEPPNKTHIYCIGCRKRASPSRLKRYHNKCIRDFYASRIL